VVCNFHVIFPVLDYFYFLGDPQTVVTAVVLSTSMHVVYNYQYYFAPSKLSSISVVFLKILV